MHFKKAVYKNLYKKKRCGKKNMPKTCIYCVYADWGTVDLGGFMLSRGRGTYRLGVMQVQGAAWACGLVWARQHHFTKTSHTHTSALVSPPLMPQPPNMGGSSPILDWLTDCQHHATYFLKICFCTEMHSRLCSFLKVIMVHQTLFHEQPHSHPNQILDNGWKKRMMPRWKKIQFYLMEIIHNNHRKLN